MKKTISAKNLAFCALCIALCVVLPMAFHAIANAGPIFLPMHIPVLLCGLACGWPYGLVCGRAGSGAVRRADGYALPLPCCPA